MSFIANMLAILICNHIDKKTKNESRYDFSKNILKQLKIDKALYDFLRKYLQNVIINILVNNQHAG